MKLSTLAAGSLGALGPGALAVAATAAPAEPRAYNGSYRERRLNRVAFPMGGLGAGMVCLEGTGAISHVSVHNHPDVFNEPCAFAAVAVRGPRPVARVLEGPVPGWKLFGLPDRGFGAGGTSYGLPRFRDAAFTARFPFATVALSDPDLPLAVEITGWSPFTPGDADSSSLPVAALEYRLTNRTADALAAVFSFNAVNFMARGDKVPRGVAALPGGFTLWSDGPMERPWEKGAFGIAADDAAVQVNHAWFRGGWFDPLTMAWNDVAAGEGVSRPPVAAGDPSPGGSLFVPVDLAPGGTRTVVVRLCWHVPTTNLRAGAQGAPDEAAEASGPAYQPWYAAHFPDVAAVAAHWAGEYAALRQRSETFAAALQDSTLPPEVIEAVGANLAILKSPTVLRQADGRMWAWEGCGDTGGCCHGTCTHVWNYAQAVAHLFPALERGLRETEFGPNQDERGHQQFRAGLPIHPIPPAFHAAADGQLGGIMKVHRDWRISGDTAWLRALWPRVRRSLDYCIATWDPEQRGWVEEPHHNTYDIEFWGPEGMCTSFYLGALRAAVLMGRALGDDVSGYDALYAAGRKRAEAELFNGEYFFQRIQWTGLHATNPQDFKSMQGEYSPEARALLEKEGPKYQYGTGCLADGVLGAWLALVCGVGEILDPEKVASHLRAVHRHNLKADLSAHVNPQRPGYACGPEGGLLICTWPRGGALSLPFVYSNEVWTGIEYQVASHSMLLGLAENGLEIVRRCRDRYDGRIRNPFDEYECGHWYARALSSYGLLQGLSGARYDAVEQVLHLTPALRGDFRCFLATAGGFGLAGVRGGRPFLDVRSGAIPLREIRYVEARA